VNIGVVEFHGQLSDNHVSRRTALRITCYIEAIRNKESQKGQCFIAEEEEIKNAVFWDVVPCRSCVN
jgi:hypothetical protein